MFAETKILGRHSFTALLVGGLSLMLTGPAATVAHPVSSYNFATPIFGLAVAPDGSLLVADNGAGVVELRKGEGHLIVELPGVTDVDPIGRGNMFALTGAGEADTAAKLFWVSTKRASKRASMRSRRSSNWTVAVLKNFIDSNSRWK